jgi:asparagine synthetase A
MNRQFTIGPVADARVIADNAEQMAQELRRTVAAVERIVDDLKVVYEVVSPLVKWLRSTLADPPAKAQVLVSTEE